MERILSADYLAEYDDKIREYHSDPYFDENLRIKKTQMLYQESINANARLEVMQKEGLVLGETERSRALRASQDIEKCIRDAWNWGVENYKGIIHEDLLLGLGNRILGYLKVNDGEGELVNVGFRTDSVKICRLKHSPPAYEPKITQKRHKFIFEANLYTHPLERAIFTNLRNYSQHNFIDGNKRLSRTLMNLILHYEKHLPILIEEGEGRFYNDLMCEAHDAWHKRGFKGSISKEERRLYGWLASKASSMLDRELRVLRNEKKFVVCADIKKKDKSGYLKIKKSIQTLMRRRNISGTARHTSKKEYDFLIRGNVCEEDLMAILDSFDFIKKYSIEPHIK